MKNFTACRSKANLVLKIICLYYFSNILQLAAKRQSIDIEPIEREKVDLEFKTPEKQEKEEEPTEELIKPGYVREVKEIPEDETDATELTIPKVKVGL